MAEISAAAGVMREFATPVPVAGKQHLVDIVGTGGDGAHTFNISSTAMFVAAAAGAKVAKHGGRSVSSSSGAADVMEEMGVSLGLSPEKVGQCIEETGMGFMFAPNHHSSMRHVAPVRKALGVKTVFNILGPLTNPAAAPNQVLGVFHVDLVGILSRVLQQLGAEHVLVVHGSDGLDEITLTGQSRVAELKNGEISEYSIHPEQFGIAVRENLDDILHITLTVRTDDASAPWVKDLKTIIESKEFRDVIEDPKNNFDAFSKPAWYKAQWGIK